MNPLRSAISQILNVLLEPLLCRIEDRLRPALLRIDARLKTLEDALIPPFLPTVIKREMQNIDSMPLPLLEHMKDLTVIGYCADDIAPLLPGCRTPPAAEWLGSSQSIQSPGPLGNLLFLDEYYGMRAMTLMAPRIFPCADSFIVATRFEYLSEDRWRSALHQIGFMEIALVAVDPLTGKLTTYAVSHASPVSCDPLFLDQRRPPTEPDGPAIWLVARKVAWHGAEWPNA